MTIYFDNTRVEGIATTNALVLPSTATATTLNGTKTLTVADSTAQLLTGTQTGYSIVLPAATTLAQGCKYEIYNTSSQVVLIKTNGGATLFTLSQTGTAYLYLQSNGTAAGTWQSFQVVSNPNFASGSLSYTLASSTTFSVTSATDVVITGFTLTPAAGTYAIWFSGAATIATNGASLTNSIYNNGSLIAGSARRNRASAAGANVTLSAMATSQFTGATACDIRVASTSGSISILDRSLLMIRLGN